MEKIDFVIIWVDGSDPEWLKEKNQYNSKGHTDTSPQRYRDWDNLMYWFRGVEKFTPWVNKIHFVTWGHLPKWLNTNHPRLNIVKHPDYIPKEYLPTFSSHTIELNLHRINGLSENFVYFNDDVFIIAPTKQSLFFKNNLPCDTAVLSVPCYSIKTHFHFCAFRDIGIINKYFKLADVIKKNPCKWFNIKYGKQVLRTIVLLPCPRFPGMWQHHLASSFKKSTFEDLWKLEYSELDETCKNKFRSMLDYNQWLFREWQIAKGEFSPRNAKFGKNFVLGDIDKIEDVCRYISKQQGNLICINDGNMTDEEFIYNKKSVIEAFDQILPDKSEFEL